jgi:hypothetical protein
MTKYLVSHQIIPHKVKLQLKKQLDYQRGEMIGVP